MSEYSGMLSPDQLRNIAIALENANSGAERMSKLFYEAVKADKEKLQRRRQT